MFPKDFDYLRTAVSTHPTQLHFYSVTYAEFEKRGWHSSGGAERANYNGFIDGLCDLLDVPRPDPTTDDPTQDAYVIERAVTFNNGAGKDTTGRIDLYKRDCFVLETKQGTTKRTTEVQAERAKLGLSNPKLRKGHAVRGKAAVALLPWPTELAKQIQTVRDVVTQAQAPLTPKQVVARFAGSGPAKVQPILDTLATLSLLRWVETENAYAT